jgi:hypothetical protein
MLESMALKRLVISIPLCSSQWTAPATPLPGIMIPPALQFGNRESGDIPGSRYPEHCRSSGFQTSSKLKGDVISRRKDSCGITLCGVKGGAIFLEGRVGSDATQVRHRSTLHSLSRSFTPMNNRTSSPETSVMLRSCHMPVGAGPRTLTANMLGK